MSVARRDVDPSTPIVHVDCNNAHLSSLTTELLRADLQFLPRITEKTDYMPRSSDAAPTRPCVEGGGGGGKKRMEPFPVIA
jgi:hypothetical protein